MCDRSALDPRDYAYALATLLRCARRSLRWNGAAQSVKH